MAQETGSEGRPFVFLDRDGTLVEDVGYVHRLEDYALLPGVVEALARLRQAGFALAIVTNQSGIGRGYYTRDSFHAFQDRLLADLADAGIAVQATYFCPHRPDAGCACRKPAPGMLEQARTELGADLRRSWVIGDRASDADLARRAGCRGAVWITLEPTATGAPAPDGVEVLAARSLGEAAAHVVRATRRRSGPAAEASARSV